MIFNKDIAKKTAELLLQINAIKLQPKIHLHGHLAGNLQYTVTIVLYFLTHKSGTMLEKH